MTDAKPPVSEEAVRAATGRGWDEWFTLLDERGARALAHPEIVKLLAAEQGVSPWWRQSVTVGYERARGLREKHQTPAGFQAGASKTLAVPVERLFAAWTDPSLRERWLPDADLTVRRATAPKSVRLTWGDGTPVDVELSAKGEAKSRVSVEHRKLADGAAVERMKGFWREALERLKEVAEG